jgi:arsenate reductase-like glutaredoxin family protein
LRRLLAGRPARDIFSWRSPTARKLGLQAKQNELSDDDLLRLMVEEPNLVRRPLFTVDGEIVPGFDKPARARLAELLGRPVGG